MKRMFKLFTLSTVLLLAGCATAAGAAIGGGIGAISGNTGAGMAIGAGVGMMVDVID